jgi:DNA invertase Pin-like site-specific DNA recombinase
VLKLLVKAIADRLTVTKIIRDAGSADGDKLSRLLSLIKPDRPLTILCYRIDRLTRHHDTTSILHDLIHANLLKIITINGEYKPGNLEYAINDYFHKYNQLLD